MLRHLLISALVVSCASSQQEITPIKKEIKVTEKVHVKEVFTGKVTFLEFDTDLENGQYEASCKSLKSKKDYTFKVTVKNQKAQAYLAENYFSQKDKRECFIKNKKFLDLVVSLFPYKKERLNVSKKHIDISKKDLARHLKEKKIRAKVYSKSANYFLFDEPFRVPLNSYITSHYGNQRIFNNKKRAQHLGNDLRAAVGVPIPVSNRGRVVFTGDWFFSGKLVVVDHGMNIFTNYMHLSKILVTEGSIINKGDIVGLAGKTGRVSGPHLHWGAKIYGHNVDGFSLVKASERHFKSTK